MPPKKICIDATGIVSTPTGLGKYSLYLLKAMLRCSDFNFTVLCQSNLSASHELFAFRSDRVRFVPIHVPVIGPQRDMRIYGLRETINEHDIFHCLSSYLPALGIKIPCVLTVHDLKYLLFPDFFRNSIKMWYYGWIIRKGTRKATRIIAVSEATKKDLVSLDIPAEKITVIHEAATVTASDGDITGAEAVGSQPYFLFIGDNRRHKNTARIMQAHTMLLENVGGRCPVLVFAGPGFESLFQKRKEGSKHIFLGPVHEKTLVTLYKNALALVYPSLYEGFGLPILEAMSLGTPVITSNRSSMPEVAGKAAILVDPYNVEELAHAMMTIMQNKDERERLTQLGLERAKEFSWDKASEEVIGLYETILFHA